MMRSPILIILASLFILTGTELHQFLRISFLVAHFRDHRQENASITLLQFLKLHYSANHPDDNDDSEDDTLPFKSAGNISHLDIPVVSFKDVPGTPYFFSARSFNARHGDGIPCHRAFSVFHPPRLA